MYITLSGFRIILLFAGLFILALFAVPRLNLDFSAQKDQHSLRIFFSLQGAGPTSVEQEVTSVIEGVVSQVGQLKHINSVSSYGQGSIELIFDKHTDLQVKKLELTSLIRQVYPKLPGRTSFPVISDASSDQRGKNPLLIYTIHAAEQPYIIKRKSEEIFKSMLTTYPDLKDINISGAEDMQLSINFDDKKCQAWGINPNAVLQAISNECKSSYPGSINTRDGRQFFIKLVSEQVDIQRLKKLRIKNSVQSDFTIQDFADVYVEQSVPSSYFRVNGKNAVYIMLYAQDGKNIITIASQLKELMLHAERSLPVGYELRLTYDDSRFLSSEIDTIQTRLLISLFVCFLIMGLFFRQWKILLNIFLSLLCSFGIIVLALWIFRMELHLYTIAGLTVAIGFMIQNIIVARHYYHRMMLKNASRIMLAGICLMISAFCMVFFLPGEEFSSLHDFAIAFCIAFVSSIVCSIWFTPCIDFLLKQASNERKKDGWPTRNINKKILKVYISTIEILAGYRRVFICTLILSIGLPLFLLPINWDGKHWYNAIYNKTIGNETYTTFVRPVVDKLTGGSLHLFVKGIKEKSGYRTHQNTNLQVTAELPYGNTPAQMNQLLADFETYIQKFKGVESFVTNVSSGQEGSINVTFKKEFSKTSLPSTLKSLLIAKSLDWAGVDWHIFGMGQAFSNSSEQLTSPYRLKLKGYNFDKLGYQAELLRNKMTKNERVNNVNLDEQINYGEKQGKQFFLNFSQPAMATQNVSPSLILNQIQRQSNPKGAATEIIFDNHVYPVVLKEQNSGSFSRYRLLHDGFKVDTSKVVKLGGLVDLQLRSISSSIHKEDRQYLKIVGFDYTGSPRYGELYVEQLVDEGKVEMPLGYTLSPENATFQNSHYGWHMGLIIVLLIVIFFISSILLEGLKYPLLIICLLPISFLGIFLSVGTLDFYFDQGGYASFLLIGEFVTSCSLYFFNDYRRVKNVSQGRIANIRLLIALAKRGKIFFVSTLAIVFGLIPFAMGGRDEVFWFSLSVSSIGGLLFSLFAILIALPAFMWNRRVKMNQTIL